MTHHLEALGWTLIHFCWQAAAIALVYRVVDAMLGRAKSHVRYVVALAAMLGMLVASLGTLAYEEAHATTTDLSWPAVSHSSAVRGLALGVAAVTGDSSVANLGKAVEAAPARAAEFEPQGVMLWLDVLWLLGVVSLSLRTVGGWWMIQRLRRSALVKAPEAVETTFRALCARLGLKKRIRVYLCEQIGSPIVVGVFRTLVLLPVSSLAALSPEQLEVVLAHELAHVRRADYFWNILQTVIETIFFFHPAVWWISRNLRQQRELCCDDFAVACCGDPVVYASALLRLEEQRRSHLHLAMALDGNQSPFSLKARIARILGDRPMRRNPKDLAPASLLGILTALALFLLPLPQVFASLSSAGGAAPEISAVIFAPPTAPADDFQCDEANSSAEKSVEMIASRVAENTVGAVAMPAVMRIDTQVVAKLHALPAMFQAVTKADGVPSGSGSKRDYIDQMKASGYDVDLEKYVAMKVQGITPEYAKQMAEVGFGKPTADELIAMKVQGVDPGEVKEMKQAGLEPSGFNDLIQYRIFRVTPEFIAAVKSSGLGNVPAHKLVEMRVQGVTPEYIKSVKQQFPEASVDDLVQMKVFNINDEFIASAKRHGFAPLTVQKLVKLRISGVLD